MRASVFWVSTDDEWEAWGEKDPYFGVLTHDRFRSDALDDASLAEFFESGENEVSRVLESVRLHIDDTFEPQRAVDFGCGVGRIVMPLARRCELVTGIDVSPSMLREATRNCEERGLDNVLFVQSDDELSQLTGTFDFVHSVIVFQHIPPRRAVNIFKALLGHLEERGVGVVHFVYAKDQPEQWDRDAVISEAAGRLRATPVWRAARQRLREDPEIQMNSIDLNKIFALLHTSGVSSTHVKFREHGSYLAATIFFQRDGHSIESS